MWWSINYTGVHQASWAFFSPALELQQGTDESERHLHFNSDFVIFVLLSYGTIGVLRGHRGHFLSFPLTSYYYFLTALEMCSILARLAFSRFDSVPPHVCRSMFRYIHNSQWAMFSSQGLGFFRLFSHNSSDDSCTML